MIIDSPIISGSYAASGSLNQLGNITITGSLTVTGDITGNITGSATNAVSASFAATATSASYAANATSASYAAAATSASYAANATSASYANNATSASYALNSTSASYAANATSASYAANSTSASYAANATSASFSATASYLSNYIPPFPYTGSADISGSLSVNGNITSTGTLTAQTLVVQTITSSVDFVTGSTHFGSIIDNTHQFTGSVTISGSLAVNGSSAILTNQTGAMSVATASYVANAQTASYVETAQTASFVQTAQTASFVQNAQTASFVETAQTASYVLNAISASFAVSSSYALTATSASNALTASYLSGYVSPFPYTGSAIISGSLEVTGSTNIPSITGSLLGTASFANTSTSASFATTASFALNVPVTASYANNAATASYWSGSIVNAATASFAETASFVTTAQTASFVQTAQTASFVVTAQTASFIQTAQTASYVLNAVSSSFATSASNALTASYLSGYVSPFPFTGSAIISGSLIVTGSVAVSNLGGSGVRYLVADESGSVTAQSASAALKSTQAFTSTAGQTTFAVTNGYSTGYVDVFINGSKLATAEFTDTSGTNIVLATGSFVNDIVEVVKYTPAAGVTNNVLRQLTTFTASAGQTVFSASYTPGLLDIFYNGSRLSPSDFTANNGTFFTLATGSADNDILDVLVYSYQVGAFNGIGGVGTADQIAFFGTTNSITGSPNFTISGSTMTVTGSLIVSGSGTFTNIGPAVFSGSITSTAGFTGSFSGTATSASYAANAELLDGLDSTVFTLTSSFNAQTASFTAFTSSKNTFSASILSYTSSINAKTSSFATTGSNTFEGIQTVNSNLIVTGSITAQTLVVQTITSSVDFVTGSTRFGSILGNTHVFTGSLSVTGSTTLNGALTGTSATFNGDIVYNNVGNQNLIITSGAANNGRVYIYSAGNADIGFQASGSSWFLNKLGIGISSPSEKIHVFGSSGATSPRILIQSHDTANATAGLTLYGRDASNVNKVSEIVTSGADLTISVNSAERMRITSAGVTAIAASSNTSDLGSTGLVIGGSSILTSGNVLMLNFIPIGPTSNRARAGIGCLVGSDWGKGNLTFYTQDASSGAAMTTGNERMRITSDGYVAIGNTSPVSRLTVNNAVVGATLPYINATSLSYNSEGISVAGSNTANANVGNGLTLYNNVASVGAYSPVIAFSSMTSGGAYNATYAFISGVYQGAGGDANWGKGDLIFGTGASYGATLRMTISSAGNIGAPSGTNIYNASDARLKQNVTTITNGLDKVMGLNPVMFNWIKGYVESEEGKNMLGFIAQEVQNIVPEAVESFSDGSNITVGESTIENPLRVNEKFIIPVLVKAIQELQEKLERNNII
jgi:hypothetical protein